MRSLSPCVKNQTNMRKDNKVDTIVTSNRFESISMVLMMMVIIFLMVTMIRSLSEFYNKPQFTLCT